MTEIAATIQQTFPDKTIVVVGDIVADQFLNGTISRVSREAPVFILRHDETLTLPGAAANASANVASLGGKPIMIGCVGRDSASESLIEALDNAGVDCSQINVVAEMKTTRKLRVLAGQHYAARQQVIRIDYENSIPHGQEVQDGLRSALALVAPRADAIIISDYDYGTIFPEIVEDALSFSRDLNIPLIVDSRYRLQLMANATTATPNREEVEQILGSDFTSDQCAGLRKQLGYKALLVTNGNQGMSLFEQDKSEVRIPAVGSTEPVDVTGAGDTVIAAYALALASGMTFEDAALIANHAGGIVVMKKGTAVAHASELIDSIRNGPVSLYSHAK
ncbi:D-glycero-beta-D-manno-heptose-7-phosphate kinase [soil metagenome]